MTPRPFTRLVDTGNVLIDVVLTVPGLPERGGDVLATSSVSTTGGAFNVMAAAARLGLPTAYAGSLGTGSRAAQARADLEAEGIAVLTPPVRDRDTGFVVCLVEPGGERTFVTSFGAETDTRVPLPAGVIADHDAVLVSGYSLAESGPAERIRALLDDLPAAATLVFDPGPLAADLHAVALMAVLARADVVTTNVREAALLGGTGSSDSSRSDVAALLAGLRRRAPQALLVLRRDRAGAVVAAPTGRLEHIAGVAVEAVDANGAGDAHTGALLAALARGDGVTDAVRYANAAAAYAVAHPGPATGPTTAQLGHFLAGSRPGA